MGDAANQYDNDGLAGAVALAELFDVRVDGVLRRISDTDLGLRPMRRVPVPVEPTPDGPEGRDPEDPTIYRYTPGHRR